MAARAKAIALSSKDNVATALTALEAGTVVVVEVEGQRESIRLLSAIPMGHKFALVNLEPGVAVVKYGEPIGRSTAKIIRGEHVHVHNTAGGRQGGK